MDEEGQWRAEQWQQKDVRAVLVVCPAASFHSLSVVPLRDNV